MRAVPRLCDFYPGICLTTEEKAWKNLSQGKKNLSQDKKNLSQVKKNLNYTILYMFRTNKFIIRFVCVCVCVYGSNLLMMNLFVRNMKRVV